MKKIFLTAIAAACIFAHPVSFAEETATRSLEEVMVTAQRKSQSLQNVPISMSVVSADDIARNSLFSFADTADLTPGVSLNSSSAALASINVRGVGPGFFAPTAQGVPIFVDEVPAVQAGAVFNTMVDVERVELLRGPQGTLYGKNAPSGAYNITTAAPGFDEVGGYLSGSYSEWDANGEPTIDVRGAVNLPLADNFAARIAGVYAESDGGIEMQSPFAAEDTTGGKDHKSLRARLLYEFSDVSQLHLIANAQQLDDTYSLRVFNGLVPATGGSNPVEAIYTEFSDREDFSARRSGSTTEVKDVALKYEWTGEPTNIDLIMSFQNFDTTLFQNQNPYPTLEPGGVDFDLVAEQATLELRAGNSGDRFDYVAGIFLSDTEAEAETIISVNVVIPALVIQETSGAAVFGNFTFHLAEQWDLAAGMRYEDNSQTYKSFVDVSGFEGNLDEKLDFNHLSWSLKLNYFASDDTTAYIAIDNAYRQGGVNSYVPAIGAIGVVLENQAIQDTADAFLFYDEEVSTAFEVGVKGNLLDRKLRYNLAVFYQEFDDHIIRQNDPSSPDLGTFGALYTLLFANAEEVVTQGVEFDITYLISNRWTIDLRTAYFDASVEEWQDRLCKIGTDRPEDGVFCPGESGSELSDLPKWNTNTQLTYFRPLHSGWNVYSTLSWSWRSEAAINGNVARHYNDPLSFFNINVGVTNETYSVTLWGKNLTDETSVQTPFETPNGDPQQAPALTGSHNNGLQYGATFTARF